MPFLTHKPTKDEIENAHRRITPLIHRTPVITSRALNEISGAELFFKCENFQKAGAFKFRGASNAVTSLNEEETIKGVATHSSGNHGAALALAAKEKGIPSYIVMPRNAPKIKKEAVKSYGAKITFCEPTLKAREETLRKVVEETGAVFVHPYDNYTIIAGQATSAKELLEETNELDFIIPPIGGGGLASGTVLSAMYFSKKTKVIGAEPKGADDAFRSLRDGKIYPSVNPQTIADGLLTSLSEKTFRILSDYLDNIFTVEEKSIISSMRLIWERLKLIIEPSSAVTLATVLENREFFEGKRVGLILSGGNVDLDNLPWNRDAE
jgi:threonine dehydratase